MLVWTGQKDNAWAIDDDWPTFGMGDGQPSLLKNMKIARLLVKLRGNAAEVPGVEHAGREGEASEEWGEGVHSA
jgi:hypothetical protein